MAGVNKAIIVGYLGDDPVLRNTDSGNAVCNLSVATTRTWFNKNTEERQQETEWHRVTVWGKQAENCEKYLSKGRQVYVEGRLRTSSYEKDGQKHWSTEIVATEVQFLGGGKDGGKGSDSDSSGSRRGRSGGDDIDPDDDIPF